MKLEIGIRKILLCIIYCCVVQIYNVNGQSEFDLNKIKAKYPIFPVYNLKDIENIKVYFDNDKLKIKSEILSESLMLNEKAVQFSERVIGYYKEFEAISSIEAKCYVPQENGKLKKYEVKEINSRIASKDQVFYDDRMEYHFNFPGLKEGSVIYSSYELELKDMHLLSPFYFANYYPTEKSSLTITFPKNVVLKYLVKGDTTGLVFTKSESKNEITYSWMIQNQRAYNDEREEGNWIKLAPRVVPYISSYEFNGRNVKVLADVSGLYQWYYNHIVGLVDSRSETVQKLSDSLVSNLKSEVEKVKTIYYWVQNNTKYIAFEEGLGGFIPRDAELVCNRRFGDCKDKSSLIYALLKAAGIKSYFTWIGTREIPYTFAECPTPVVDNHMIISYNDNGVWNFLDGTANGIMYGIPTAFIQGKEALIGISKDSFVVATVPVLEKEYNFSVDSLNVGISGNDLIGYGKTSYGGYWKDDISYKFYNISEKDRQKELAGYFKFVNNKTIIDSLKWEKVDTISAICSFSYIAKLPEYPKTINKKLYVNLNLRRDFQGDLFDTLKQKTDIEFRYKFFQKQITVFNIPDGYKIAKLPANVNFSKDVVALNVNYNSDGNKVIMEGVFSYDDLYRRRDKYDVWNEFIKVLDSTYSQILVLEKI